MFGQQLWNQSRCVRARISTPSTSSEQQGHDVSMTSSPEVASRQDQQSMRMPPYGPYGPPSSFQALLNQDATQLFGEFGHASPQIPLVGEGTSPQSNGSDVLRTSSRELNLPHRDKPSGPPLRHDPRVRNYVQGEEDFPGDDVDPGVSKGRGPTKPMPVQDRFQDRIHVTQAVAEKKFEPDSANKTISALLREQYKGDKNWDQVARQTRDILWQGFGMRFRWDPNMDKEMVTLWEKVNRASFVIMMATAKRIWINEKKRPKWCSISRFFHLTRYWEMPAVQEDSLKHSENRGVVRNEEGQVEKRAVATFTGGSTSMLRRDKNMAGNSSTANVLTIGNFKATHMTGLKKKVKRKSQQGENSVGGSSQVESESAILEASKWIHPDYEKIVEHYDEFAAIKYAGCPQDKPGEWDPRDEECWARAVGGPKKGKVVGVSNHAILEELGYKMNRRISGTDVHLTTESIQNEFKQTLETMTTQFGKERESYMSEIAKFGKERESYMSEIAKLRKETQETRRVLDMVLAKVPGVVPPHPPPSDAD